MQAELTAERVAQNQSTFRDANEQLVERAEAIGVRSQALPFICECPDPACSSIALIARDDYEHIRSDGKRFFAVPGHEVCEVDGVTVARIVERNDVFSVLEKVGAAGETAEALDPRS